MGSPFSSEVEWDAQRVVGACALLLLIASLVFLIYYSTLSPPGFSTLAWVELPSISQDGSAGVLSWRVVAASNESVETTYRLISFVNRERVNEEDFSLLPGDSRIASFEIPVRTDDSVFSAEVQVELHVLNEQGEIQADAIPLELSAWSNENK